MPLAPTIITCDPVSIQLLLGSGLVAKGSVLLESVPPRNMYINPTLSAGGSLRAIIAPTHSSALASMHIGSGPGEFGSSGMQVKPLVPFRIVRISPFSFATMMVAFLATAGGAASIALL